MSFAAFYASYQYLPLGQSSGRGAVANVVAYGAGMLNSFLLNRLWTFRAEGQVAVHALKFVLLNAATSSGSTSIVLLLVDRAGLPALAVWLPLTIAILDGALSRHEALGIRGAADDAALQLIVNADDFGIAEAVNRGIVEALRRGIVTSTSLMATGEAFEPPWSLHAAVPVSPSASILCSRSTGR